MSAHPGHLRNTKAGTWEAIFQKRSCTFKASARNEAVDWLHDASAAHRLGQPMPEPRPEHLSRPPKRYGTEFLPVAQAWHRETYDEDFQADVDRAADVARDIERLNAYFTRNNLHLETFTRAEERTLYRWLLRGDVVDVAPLPEGCFVDDLVTTAQALALPGICSQSTFKNRKREGRIRPVSDEPVQMWRLGDLCDPAARLFPLAGGQDGPDGPGARPRPAFGPLARSTARNTRWVLRAVLAYARGRNIAVPQDAGTAKLPKPPEREMTKKDKRSVAVRTDAQSPLTMLHELEVGDVLECTGQRCLREPSRRGRSIFTRSFTGSTKVSLTRASENRCCGRLEIPHRRGPNGPTPIEAGSQVITRLVVLALTAFGLATLGAPGLASSAPAQTAPSAQAHATKAEAFALAEETDEPVELANLRDEYSQTFANPDGATMTQEMHSAPIFGEDEAGNLVEIDTSLEMRADGTVAPKAAAVGLEFPRDDSESITMEDEGHVLSVEVPGTLSEPTLDGDTATYEDVFPDVDLKLTATADGFRQVYVVNTREAAQSEEFRQLVLDVDTESGALLPRAGGGVMVVDAMGDVVFASAPALMWDSSGVDGEASDGPAATSSSPSEMDGAEPEPLEEFAAPSPGDAWVAMPVRVGDDQIVVRPDQEMLDDPDTVYPVFIDPPANIDRSERTMIRSDGYSDWQFTGDEGMGRCPTSYSTECGSAYTKRLLYEFGRGGLNRGDLVLGAEFAVVETHAVSCTKKPVDLLQTGEIEPSTNWPGPGVVKEIGTQSVAHGRSGCPDAEVAFSNTALRNSARDLATGALSRLTLSLRAGNESDQLGWKRFANNAVLRTVFVRLPGEANPVGVMSGTELACSADPNQPVLVSSTSPTFKATMQTLVDVPDGDARVGRLKGQFEIQNVVNGAWAGLAVYNRPSGEVWSNDDNPVTLNLADVPKVLPLGRFRFRVTILSHYINEGYGSDTIEGAPGDWCYFTVDPDPPVAPVVMSADGVYAEELDGVILWGGGVGKPGKFTYAPNPADNDPNIASYQDSVIPSTATISNPSSTTSTVTPQKSGAHQLIVSATDKLGRHSAGYVYRFNVKDPDPPVGHWHVAQADETTDIADTSDPDPAVSRNPLRIGSTDMLSDLGTGRRGVLDLGGLRESDRALWFDGTARTARTDSTVIDTGSSFAASAWVMLADTTQDRTVLSQYNDATTVSPGTGVEVRYLKNANAWSAIWTYRVGGVLQPPVKVTATTPVVPKAWTQVAVSYDASTARLKLL